MDARYEYFLGGRDLEMTTIAELLHSVGETVHDRHLIWGAKASAYREELAAARSTGAIPVLIELTDDLGLANDIDQGHAILIDHHGDRAGKDVPTSIEQIYLCGRT